jgi:kynureninase
MIDTSAIKAMDAEDPLAHKRADFQLRAGKIYLDGNSLGALPMAVAEHLQATIRQQWGEDLISSWNRHGWIDLPQHVGEKVAALIGAGPGQVICCDSISVNLFKLLAIALQLQPGRRVILSAADNFPTDLYMAQGLAALQGEHGCQLQLVAESDLLEAIDENVAAVMLSHVNFRSGAILPMHDPVDLDACEVDFAVGCGYKYLNGGPGAPAFVYAARRHHPGMQQPLTGWMGHRDPFAFDPVYHAGAGMQQFLCGTPPILSLAALDAALDVLTDSTTAQRRQKSIALGTLFVDLVRQCELAAALQLYSPEIPDQRGSQLAWSHPEAYGLCQAWIEHGVTADFREPDILRVGFSPLYTSFADIYEAIERLRLVMASGAHLDPRWRQRHKVT